MLYVYSNYLVPTPEDRKRSLDSNSLLELTELVHKGEQRGIFVERMPASIQQAIHAENITFVKNRDVYNPDYFSYLLRLISQNSVGNSFSFIYFFALVFHYFMKRMFKNSSNVLELILFLYQELLLEVDSSGLVTQFMLFPHPGLCG